MKARKALFPSLLLIAAQVSVSGATATGTLGLSDQLFRMGEVRRLRIQLDGLARSALRAEPRAYAEGSVTEEKSEYRVTGIHLKGQYGTFETIDGRPSLTVSFDKFVLNQTFHGLDKLHLNNSVSDPSLMTELLCANLFRAANVPVSRVTHARVELNGRDLGLYVLVEGHNKKFLKRHFSKATGNFYESGFMKDITEPLKRASGDGPADHADLKALIAACQEPDPDTRLAKLASLVDMDRFYSLLALESMTRHFDGYSMGKNNYWVYHDPASGKMTFIPYGMDQMFWNPRAALLPEPQGVVAQAVLYAPAGRQAFRDRCTFLFTNLLANFTNRIETLHERLRPVIAQCGTNAVHAHERGVASLKQRVRERFDYLRQEFAAPQPQPVLLQPGTEIPLTNWLFSVEKGNAATGPKGPNPKSGGNPNAGKVEKVTTGAAPLELNLEENAVVGWQCRVLLPAGVYRVSLSASTDQGTFQGSTFPVALGIYGLEEIQLETVRKDSAHADLTCVFAMPRASPEEAVIRCHIYGKQRPQAWRLSSPLLTRLQ
jgi:spore coat protein H